MPRAGEVFFNALAQGAQADAPEQHPDFQRTETPRQLRSVIPKRERLIGFATDHARVIRVMRERGAGLFRIAVKDAAAVDREVEPLVRIERNGVRALDAA